jgi:hypothetical protein
LSLAGQLIGQKELMTPFKKTSSILCGAGAVVDMIVVAEHSAELRTWGLQLDEFTFVNQLVG